MSQRTQNGAAPMSPDQRHATFSDLLPEYAIACARAKSPGREWQALEAHLASCEDCRRAAAELTELLVDAYNGAIEPALVYPEPDLSFLSNSSLWLPDAAVPDTDQPPPALDRPGRAFEQIEHLVIEFSAALVQSLRQPRLAGAYRGPHYCSYELPRQSDSDMHITIDVTVVDEARKQCRVLLSIVDPRNPFDQESRSVTLHYGTFTRQATTDHQGYTAFDGIPLESISELQFTITPP